MKVTQIVELSKKRSKVYIDQEFAFVLYKGELRLYGVREGEEISEENFYRIRQEVLPKRAKLRAMNLLQSREYTTAQLRAKLKQGLYPDEVIEEALEYVASFRYTDDFRYTKDYITYNADRKSRKRIEQDLLNRGVPKEIFERAWEEWQEQGGGQNEQLMIRELLQKKHYIAENADYREQQRMYAFLMRKGFSGEQIRRAMDIS